MSTIINKPRAAAHGRPKEIVRAMAVCDVCGDRELCLGFDSSDGEYGWVWICHGCTANHFTLTGDDPDHFIEGETDT